MDYLYIPWIKEHLRCYQEFVRETENLGKFLRRHVTSVVRPSRSLPPDSYSASNTVHKEQDWSLYLPTATFSHNLMGHSHRFLPFTLLHGYVPRLPIDLQLDTHTDQMSKEQRLQNYGHSLSINMRQLMLNV